MTAEHERPASGSPPRQSRVVTVVVPHYNDPRLAPCLDALEALHAPPGWSVEVVVVDNGSDHPPRDLVEGRRGMRYLEEPRGGSYAARNAGLAVATGEIIAFTDSDCRPAQDWLAVAVGQLEADPGLSAVAGRVQTVFDTPRPESAVGWWDLIEAFPQQVYVAEGYGVTANLVVRRTAGDSVGWFDGAAVSGGDRDFGRRLTRSGRALAYADDAVVAHPARTTWRELLAKGRRTAKGQARMDVIHGAGIRGYVRSISVQYERIRTVVRRAVKEPRLPDASARAQYLTVGLVYRCYWFAHRSGWWLRYAARPDTVVTARSSAE